MASRVTIEKEFSFDAAHQLPHHHGKCSSLHGHTYRLVVEVSGELIPARNRSDEGMIMDFSDLKELVRALIIDRCDHAFLLGTEPLPWVMNYEDMAGFTIETLLRSRVARLPIPVTTAEHLSVWVLETLQSGIATLNLANDVKVESVRLYETPSSCAIATRGDES